MFKRLLILTVFLSFGWLGASQISNQNLTDEQIEALMVKAQGGQLESENFGLAELLVQMGTNYYIPTSQELASNSKNMAQAITQYCGALENSTQDSFKSDEVLKLKSEAEQAWLAAMGSYHKIFAAPFGPVYANSREIANNIYSWPLMNECGMHVEMVDIKTSGAFNPRTLYSSKGLMAVEFGLFKDLDSTTCNTRNKAFNKVHEWLKNDEFSKTKDMCGLAKVAAEDVALQSEKLVEAWSIDSGNYTRSMVDGSEYESFKFALNRITDGLFTMIEVAKDVQLGKPMGLHKDCLDASGNA